LLNSVGGAVVGQLEALEVARVVLAAVVLPACNVGNAGAVDQWGSGVGEHLSHDGLGNEGEGQDGTGLH
jgi:hypothetical protein